MKQSIQLNQRQRRIATISAVTLTALIILIVICTVWANNTSHAFGEEATKYTSRLTTLNSTSLRSELDKSPKLTVVPFAWLSSSYKIAKKKQVILTTDIDTLKTIIDGVNKDDTLSKRLYTIHDDYELNSITAFNTYSSLISAALATKDTTSYRDNSKKLEQEYRSAAKKYQKSLSSLPQAPELYRSYLAKLKQAVDKRIQLSDELVKKYEDNSIDASATMKQYKPRLAIDDAAINRYFTAIYYGREAYKNNTAPVLSSLKEQLADAYQYADNNEAYIQARLATLVNLSKEYIPMSYEEDDYFKNGQRLQVWTNEMGDIVRESHINKKIKDKLLDEVNAAALTTTLYSDPDASDASSDSLIDQLAFITSEDSAVYTKSDSGKRLEVQKSKLKSYQDLQAPAYLTREVAELIGVQKKIVNLEETASKQSGISAAKSYFALSDLFTEQDRIITSIGKKVDDSKSLGDNLRSQLDAI